MAKKKKVKIPKSIGGVKLPKEMRKPAEALIAKAQSPEGRRMIAAGLAMAASAVASRASTPPPEAPRPPQPPVPPVPPHAPQPPHAPEAPVPPRPFQPEGGTSQGPIDPGQIADAVGKATSAFFDGFFNRRR